MEAYTGFAQVYDTFMDNVPYDEWGAYLVSLLKKYGVKDGLVLDMGCGWGAMTMMTLSRFPSLEMTMADVNERALALAAQNVAKNHMQAKAVLSDGFSAVEGEFDAVMTNPPIRAGKAVIYRMFEDAKAHLAPGGALYLVIRKQQGAPSALKFLKELYANAEVIARDGGYWIIACEV